MYFASNYGSWNTFVYQPTLDMLELKKYNGTDYVLSWKSKGVCDSKLKPLNTAFLHRIKPLYRIWIKLDKDPSTVKQNNYSSKHCLWFRCLHNKSGIVYLERLV